MDDHSGLAVHGHDDAVTPILQAIRAGRAAHAYLLNGPPNVGKGAAARMLAAAFLCAEANAPCGMCSSCRRVARGTHPDLDLVTPGGPCDESDHDHTKDNSRDVRICQIRRASRTLSLTPFEGRARVTLIDPADALNAQSADAFLKTLEEPPPASAIVLTVVEPGTLPETIRSRCRSVVLRPVPPAAIERVLTEQYRVESAQATLLARLADGRIGWAIRAAVDDTFMQRRARILDDAAILPRTGRIERFSWAEKTAADFSRDRVRVYDTLSLLASWWRDVLHHGAGRAHGIINTDRSEEIADVSAICPPAGAVGMLRAILRARRDLDANVNARLALEALVLRLPPARQVAGR